MSVPRGSHRLGRGQKDILEYLLGIDDGTNIQSDKPEQFRQAQQIL